MLRLASDELFSNVIFDELKVLHWWQLGLKALKIHGCTSCHVNIMHNIVLAKCFVYFFDLCIFIFKAIINKFYFT